MSQYIHIQKIKNLSLFVNNRVYLVLEVFKITHFTIFRCYLAIFRKEKNLNQDDLAKILHISRKTLSLIENGGDLPFSLAIKISRYFKKDIFEIWKEKK